MSKLLITCGTRKTPARGLGRQFKRIDSISVKVNCVCDRSVKKRIRQNEILGYVIAFGKLLPMHPNLGWIHAVVILNILLFLLII